MGNRLAACGLRLAILGRRAGRLEARGWPSGDDEASEARYWSEKVEMRSEFMADGISNLVGSFEGYIS